MLTGVRKTAPLFLLCVWGREGAGQRMEKSFSGGGETERDAVSHIERRVWRSGGRSVETGGTACRMERDWREKQRRMDGVPACCGL